MKKNILTKLSGILLGLGLSLGILGGVNSIKSETVVDAGSDVTFTTTTGGGFTNDSKTSSGITLSFTGGDNPISWQSGHVRIYTNGTVKISATSNMSKFVVTCTGSGTNNYAPGGLSVKSGGGSYSCANTQGTWSGTSKEVVLKASKQTRISSVVVTLADGGGGSTGGDDTEYVMVTNENFAPNSEVFMATGLTANDYYLTGVAGTWLTAGKNKFSETLHLTLDGTYKALSLKNGENGYVNMTGNSSFSHSSTSVTPFSIDGNNNLCYGTYNGNTAATNVIRDNTSSNGFRGGYGTSYPAAHLYYFEAPSQASLVSISALSATVSAKTGDTAWTIENVSVTGVLDDSPNVVDVSKYVTVSVVESVPAINDNGTMSVTLKATGNKQTAVSKQVSATATLTFVNPYAIETVFEKANGTTVTVDGIYYGNNASGSPLILDGDYGFLAYGGDASSLNVGDYVTVSGTLNIYNGLYETKNDPVPTITKLTDSARISRLSTPNKYIVTGNEGTGLASQKVANRLTSLTGVVSNFSSTTVGSRSNVTFTVNSKSITVTVVGNLFTQETYDKFNASKTNSEEITIEGISTYFYRNSGDPGFEVEFSDFVEKKADYLAENFAQDLLELTDEVCAGYDGKTNNKDALGNAWLTLQDADHYLGLAGTEQAKLGEATASTTGTDVEKAMARYDYLVAKYGLASFIDGRSVSPVRVSGYINVQTDNTATIVIAVVSVLSLATLCTLIIIKRKKTIER